MSSQVNCIYGDTNSTKTSRLGDAAEYYHKLTGLPSFLISSDTGGWDAIAHLVSSGIVIPFRLSPDRVNYIETVMKLSMGWWPVDPKDPASQLQAPALVRDKRAAVLFDGITSICRVIMGVHEASVKYDEKTKQIQPQDIKVPEQPKDSYIKSGDYTRRFLGRSDYGGVQGRAAEMVRNSGHIGVPVWWSALEDQGTDEQTKRPVYGPQFIGQALTGACGNWFANLVHLDLVSVAKEEMIDGLKITVSEQRPYLFTKTHLDPNNSDPLKIPYPAKVRAPKELFAKVPTVMRPRLDSLLTLLDALAAEASGTKAASSTNQTKELVTK